MSRIFISYRRDDAEGEAGRIADRLIEHFGADAVFHDRQSLRDGDAWRERIDAELAGCELVLVVIGPQWETLALADGTRRLHAADDIAAYEVASALQRRVRLIPLLVRRTELPAAAALPAALVPLRGMQARRLHADAFGPLVDSLIDNIEGRPRRRRLPAWAWAGATLALAGLAFGVTRWNQQPPPQASAVAATGDLRLRLQLPPDALADDDEPRFVMKQSRPPSNVKLLLDQPASAAARPVEFMLRGMALPPPRQEFEADVVPQPQSARQGAPTRATVCLTRTDAVAADGLRALVDCPANDRCSLAADDPGHFVACGTPLPQRRASRAGAAGLDWPWLSSAHAQPARRVADAPGTTPTPAPASASASAPGPAATAAAAASNIWIIPAIETLHRRRAAGNGSAFTEIRLSSPPLRLPALLAATQVSVQIKANGRLAWIDGLPPDASAVPFAAASGLALSFGMENLGFSGARQGREAIELVLRFLAGGTLVQEVPIAFDIVALRDQPGGVVGEPALGIRWTARYHASSAGSDGDRWQVFLLGSTTPQGLDRAKQRFDDGAFAVDWLGRPHRLVAVIRPPLRDPPRWGLNVGLLLPSGQIRFTFDDATSAAVCGRLHRLAQQPASGVRTETYRRSVDGTATTEWCKRFAQRPP